MKIKQIAVFVLGTVYIVAMFVYSIQNEMSVKLVACTSVLPPRLESSVAFQKSGRKAPAENDGQRHHHCLMHGCSLSPCQSSELLLLKYAVIVHLSTIHR